MTFEEYCRAVSIHIRFKPDRGAVEVELLAHLEDRRDALKETGVPDGEAEERAVAAMGDPAEIGRALDKCHSPLLGWAGRLVHALAWALGALSLLAVFMLVFMGDGTGDLPRLFPDLESVTESACARAEELTGAFPVELYPQGEARAGHYTFRVERALLYPGEEENFVVVFLREGWSDPRLGPSQTSVSLAVDGTRLSWQMRESLGGEDALFGSCYAYGSWLPEEAEELILGVCDSRENERASFSISLKGGTGP